MSSKLKMMGAVLLSACAMGGATASSATAAQFHSEISSTLLLGQQVGTEVTAFNGGGFSCNEVNYVGLISGTTTTTAAVIPSYLECNLFGFTAEVKANECEFVFHVAATNTMDIECPAGKEMEFIAKLFGTTKCTVKIPGQTGLSGIAYANEGSGKTRDIKVSTNISTGIKYSQSPGSGIGKCTTEHGLTNASSTGTATIKGFNNQIEQVGIWVD